MTIRQPIITVAGHVDHGKTSILDALRGTKIADGEAGSITQKISFTKFPVEQLRKVCPLIEKSGIKLMIPGFLFIDTPGHAAFNNLRKRGGSLADIAILVIDINEGIKPQTAEVLQILKEHKTPFIIALNKIDRIRGWQKLGGNLKENINSQQSHVKQDFDEKYYTIVGALNSYGFQADLFYNIEDFSKNIALVPCSAHTKEGISEILFVMAGLSQRFLMNQLEVGDVAKGVVLEIKKENNLSYIESILYDGSLKINDEIAIASFDGFIKTRVKSIQEIEPLSFKFKSKELVSAASGIRMQINSKDEILPGMPFMLYTSEEEVKEIAEAVLERAKGGEDFAALATEFGSDATKDAGGSLGWFGRGMMVPEFEEAVFAVEPGQVGAELVETEFGYHIVKVDGKRSVRDFGVYLDDKIGEASFEILVKGVHDPLADYRKLQEEAKQARAEE